MHKLLNSILLMVAVFGSTSVLRATPSQSSETFSVQFTPPPGWRFGELNPLLPSVKVVVVGKGQHELPPSMTLGTESYRGSLKDYLKIVKTINDAQGGDWKDLGAIRTEAGEASLSQLDTKTEWGEMRMMHVILLKNETIYILTAAALKDEFPKFYKDFFQSMRSLRIEKSVQSATAERTAAVASS